MPFNPNVPSTSFGNWVRTGSATYVPPEMTRVGRRDAQIAKLEADLAKANEKTVKEKEKKDAARAIARAERDKRKLLASRESKKVDVSAEKKNDGAQKEENNMVDAATSPIKSEGTKHNTWKKERERLQDRLFQLQANSKKVARTTAAKADGKKEDMAAGAASEAPDEAAKKKAEEEAAAEKEADKAEAVKEKPADEKEAKKEAAEENEAKKEVAEEKEAKEKAAEEKEAKKKASDQEGTKKKKKLADAIAAVEEKNERIIVKKGRYCCDCGQRNHEGDCNESVTASANNGSVTNNNYYIVCVSKSIVANYNNGDAVLTLLSALKSSGPRRLSY